MVYAQSHESIPTKINWLVYVRISHKAERTHSKYTLSLSYPFAFFPSLPLWRSVPFAPEQQKQFAQRIETASRQAKKVSNQQIHTIDLHCALRAYISHFALFAHSTEAFKGWKFTVNTYFPNFACAARIRCLSASSAEINGCRIQHTFKTAPSFSFQREGEKRWQITTIRNADVWFTRFQCEPFAIHYTDLRFRIRFCALGKAKRILNLQNFELFRKDNKKWNCTFAFRCEHLDRNFHRFFSSDKFQILTP